MRNKEFSIKEWILSEAREYVIWEWEFMKDGVKRAHAFAGKC